MKNLLYIGNKLDHNRSNITTIDTLGKKLVGEGYKVIFSSSKINKFFRLLDMIISVLKNSRRIDFVLIDTYSTQNFYYALCISQFCRMLRLKYIPILHGGDLPKRLKNNIKLSRCIFKNAYVNVSPSLYLKQIFNEYGFDNVRFIANSIDINNYPFSTKRISKLKLFWLRSYKKIYNPLMAIKVAAKLKENGFDCQLCMVGPDGDGSFLFAQKLARELKIDVSLKGKMNKLDWIQLSTNYNIFLNTTNFDNMPVSVIEAMALGFPIVSTNVGGIPNLIDHGVDGLLVDENDVDAMVNQIINLKNNPELVKRLSLNARKKAKEFDWHEVKAKWNSLFSNRKY